MGVKFHPDGMILAAFCFVTAKMFTIISGYLVYMGDINTFEGAAIWILIVTAGAGFLFNSFEETL